MVPSDLIHLLFLKLKGLKIKYVYVGDVSQLPPVGGSSFVYAYLSCGLPVYELTENMRSKTYLLSNFRAVRNGEPDKVMFDKTFEFIEGTPHDVYSWFRNSGKTHKEVLFLAPYNQVVHTFNKQIRGIVKPEYANIDITQLDIGDPVMQTKNVYEENYNEETGEGCLMNGEVGVVVSRSPLTVDFDGVIIYYQHGRERRQNPFSRSSASKKYYVEDLVLCYACTIHKCVSGNTLISTDTGLQYIKDMTSVDGWSDMCVNVKTREGNADTSRIYKGDVEDSLIITTTNGYLLEGSHRHPVLTVDTNGKEQWVKLPDIKNGDILVMRCGAMSGKDSRSLIEERHSYVVGMLIGGNITPDARPKLNGMSIECNKQFILGLFESTSVCRRKTHLLIKE